MKLGPEYPEILADLAMQIRELLIEAKLPEALAEQLALASAERMRQRWGGQLTYIPIGASHEAMRRWLQIWSKFTGDNIPQLAKEFSLSEVYVYQIIRRMREIERERVQSKLNL